VFEALATKLLWSSNVMETLVYAAAIFAATVAPAWAQSVTADEVDKRQMKALNHFWLSNANINLICQSVERTRLRK
jgi:hypothetical protein